MSLSDDLGDSGVTSVSDQRSGKRNSIAGLVAGMSGVVCGHPFDTIKTKMQASSSAASTIRSVTQDIFKNDGMKGFYRGVTPPLFTAGLLRSIVFMTYENARRLLGCTKPPGQRGGFNDLGTSFLAGMVGGISTSWATVPLELTKIQLQLQRENLGPQAAAQRQLGPIAIARQQIRNHGVWGGVYRGFSAGAARDMFGTGVYFTIYEVFKGYSTSHPLVQGGGMTGQLLTSFVSGGLAGMATWLVIFPIDTVKTRLQREAHLERKKYKGVVDCVQTMLRTEGRGALYRGLMPTLVRAFPIHSVVFLMYEGVHIALADVEALDG